MKNTIEAETVIDNKSKDKTIFSSGYYILFFGHIIEGELYAYDTRDPMRAYRDILKKNPEYEFLRIESYPNEVAVRDICKMVRQSREARQILLPAAEMFEVIVKPK